MRVTPLWPASSAAQVSLVPIPSADTNPMPVTTTRLFKSPSLFFGLRVLLDVVDGFLDARDLFSVLVGDFDPEFLLERHDELYRVERVSAEIVDERGICRHFLFVHAELLHDDALDLVCDCRHSKPPNVGW